jgi:Tol biopolymer transport system component
MVQVTPVTISKIPLPVKGEWSTNLDWCKDGNRLLFTSNISTYNALWTIPLNGLDPVELLNGDFTCARWSADGSAIYYVEEVGLGTGPLTKMRVDGNTGGRVGDPRVLLPDLDATGLSISENNDNLLFSRRDIYSNLWYTPIGEAGREKARPLTSGTAIAFSPAISPDGQSLVYALLKEGRADIYLLPTDGGNPKRLTFDGSHNLGPAWSPDGKGIAYAGSSGGKDYNIKILNLRSGKSRTYHSPILRREDGFSGLHWGADGNIYCQGPGNRNIILLNAESGVQRELIQNEKEGWIFNARVSPDGKSVAVDWNNWVKGPGIYLLSLTDTAQVCILESESEFICHLNWSPDGEWIYCYDFKNLYRLHRTGAKLDTLAVLPFATERDFFYAALPDVAPDLGAFISVEMDVKTDVWLIENFDPDAR